jgi:hypothetical protein
MLKKRKRNVGGEVLADPALTGRVERDFGGTTFREINRRSSVPKGPEIVGVNSVKMQ